MAVPDTSTIAAVHNALTAYLDADRSRAIWCVSDTSRPFLIDALSECAAELGKPLFIIRLPGPRYTEEDLNSLAGALGGLSANDLLIINLAAIDQTITSQRLFPAFRSPAGFRGRSAIIRPHFPDGALVAQLATPRATADKAARDASALCGSGPVRITAPGGTDLTCTLQPARTLGYWSAAGTEERHAYLPPAEVARGIVPGSANGTIVADITVGEFVVRGELWDRLGLVPAPVRLTLADGRVTEIDATSELAVSFAACLDRLAAEAPVDAAPAMWDPRAVVELGIGLADGAPTGEGAPDECLRGTLHFGIGNDQFFGGTNRVPMHLDVILRGPARAERVD
jgi:hypothetical protein